MNEEIAFYRLGQHSLKSDGTIFVGISIYDDAIHSLAERTIVPENEDYPFWRWIVTHPDFQRTISNDELAGAKYRFEFESGFPMTDGS